MIPKHDDKVKPNRAPLIALARGAALGLLLGLVFMAGFAFRGAMPSLAASANQDPKSDAQQSSDQFPILTQAEGLLRDHYVRALPADKVLEYGAIRGLLQTLNDHLTFFIEPPVAASESNVLAGQYGGIGVQVKRDEQGRFVLYPFRDGPAARAGIQDGDVILKVNDLELPASTGIDSVDQSMRGEVKADSGVKILIQRGVAPNTEEKSYFVLYETIEVPSVVWRTLAEEPTFGYIQILRFTSRTPDELQQAFTELRGADGKAIRGLILDVRNNPGGLLDESLKVTSQFLPNDLPILYEQTRDAEKIYKSENGAVLTDLPMFALINGGTASAAEILIGALKDHHRATIIGQKSFGKGSVQLIFQLSDKSSLHISTAEFFPPSKQVLDGVGIEPDVPMIPDQNGRDVELGEAIRRLREKIG